MSTIPKPNRDAIKPPIIDLASIRAQTCEHCRNKTLEPYLGVLKCTYCDHFQADPAVKIAIASAVVPTWDDGEQVPDMLFDQSEFPPDLDLMIAIRQTNLDFQVLFSMWVSALVCGVSYMMLMAAWVTGEAFPNLAAPWLVADLGFVGTLAFFSTVGWFFVEPALPVVTYK